MKKFALVGNPNSGKTTLFNTLTGSTARVGNWPGVTVEKRDGLYKKAQEPISIIDLPGIYSLSPYTPEEIISRNYIIDEKPDCIINIVDVTNLERNLYLTTQLLEMDVEVIVALNMMDVLKKNGDSIDKSTLEKRLGVPVVEISALKSDNLDELMNKALEISTKERKGYSVLDQSGLAHVINDVKTAFKGLEVSNPLFHAIKLIEMDDLEIENHKELLKIVDEFKKTYKDDVFGQDLEAVVADQRYKYIEKNFSSTVNKSAVKNKEELTKSEKVDKVLTNKWAAIPIFLLILFTIFHLTFSADFLFLGRLINFEAPSFEGKFFEGLFYTPDGINSPGVILFNFVDLVTSGLADVIAGWLENAPAWVSGLINDGIVSGVFAVLSFVPQILLLFLFFSILEDSGYMARIAFILDRIFKKFGLSGRSFLPMIMGFGCSVPAMTNTRTLSSEREKIATIRVIPFFSCGAKLPILTAIAGGIVQVFGYSNADIITYSMYLIGILIAIISLIIMNLTTLRGVSDPFIMELPEYHLPQFKSLMVHLWDKLKHYVEKAFTIILLSTIAIWFLSSFGWNWHMVDDISDSILGSIGRFIQPLFTPLGFGSQLSSYGFVFAIAAITGLIAKEDVIATFTTIAACLIAAGVITDPSIIAGLEGSEDGIFEVHAMIAATGIKVPGLISFIVFNMTTIPCFAAVATAKAELPKKKLINTIIFWLVASYLAASVCYLVLSWWWTALIIVPLFVGLLVALHFFNKFKDKKKLELRCK